MTVPTPGPALNIIPDSVSSTLTFIKAPCVTSGSSPASFIIPTSTQFSFFSKNEILNVQPHSIDAEQAVLGSMLSDKDSVNKAFEKKLASDHFYKKSHALIFAAMEILDKKNEPIDTVSVAVSYTHLTLPTKA